MCGPIKIQVFMFLASWDPNQPRSPGGGEVGGGCRGEVPGCGSRRATEQGAAQNPPAPLSPPCSRLTKGLPPLHFLFNHISPLSIKAIFKVNYLLPSTANPT